MKIVREHESNVRYQLKSHAFGCPMRVSEWNHCVIIIIKTKEARVFLHNKKHTDVVVVVVVVVVVNHCFISHFETKGLLSDIVIR